MTCSKQEEMHVSRFLGRKIKRNYVQLFLVEVMTPRDKVADRQEVQH